MVLIAMLVTGFLEADQIPPKPFRALVADSEHIVVAEVIAVGRRATKEGDD
jgi:hypothetical protein